MQKQKKEDKDSSSSTKELWDRHAIWRSKKIYLCYFVDESMLMGTWVLGNSG